MIYLGPLAAALSVDPRLFADLPAIPPSGAAEYLVESAESGIKASQIGHVRSGVTTLWIVREVIHELRRVGE
jgi:hypothetical protein